MENKYQVVIEECGIRFVLKSNSYVGNRDFKCEDCIAKHLCINSDGPKRKNLMALCWNNVTLQNFQCTSATKIEYGAKVYGSWNRDDALYLVNKQVEWLGGTDGTKWIKNRLQCVDHTGSPFYFGTFYASIIREIKPETITLTEARERFNIPENIIIEVDK